MNALHFIYSLEPVSNNIGKQPRLLGLACSKKIEDDLDYNLNFDILLAFKT